MPPPPLRRLSLSVRTAGTKAGRWAQLCNIITTTPWSVQEHSILQILKENDPDQQLDQIRMWRENKKQEFNYVGLAGSVVASAVCSSFSWNRLEEAHWIASAVWYGAVILSTTSVIEAFHLSMFMADTEVSGYRDRELRRSLFGEGAAGIERKPNWLLLYALQVPVMMLSWSLISYVGGLSVLVCEPLWQKGFGIEWKTAFVYLAYLVLGVGNYLIVCLYIYKTHLRTALGYKDVT